MPLSRVVSLFAVFILLSAAQAASEVAEYQTVRAAQPDGRSVAVDAFTLTRDAHRFTFRSGTFHFLAPLGERTFGAVFVGDGTYVLEPVTQGERRHLALATGENSLPQPPKRILINALQDVLARD